MGYFILSKMQSHQCVYSHCSASRPIHITKVKTLTTNLGLGLTFDLKVSACQGPTMCVLMSTKFGAAG